MEENGVSFGLTTQWSRRASVHARHDCLRLFRVPLVVIPFAITVFYRRPGHFMRGFLAGVVALPVFSFGIFIPRAVEGFFLDILCMDRQHVADRFRQRRTIFVRHPRLLLQDVMGEQ